MLHGALGADLTRLGYTFYSESGAPIVVRSHIGRIGLPGVLVTGDDRAFYPHRVTEMLGHDRSVAATREAAPRMRRLLD